MVAGAASECRASPIGEPAPIEELNTPSDVTANWIRPDDCTLYFASDQGGERACRSR